jgi:histidinol-phosphate aminotransferase
MVADLPEGCVLVLDEAYVEFAHPDTVPDIGADDPRVIRFRTFSKAYGMAGARVGYGIGAPELITAFNKVRNHFGMCRISQAGALAALEDSDHLTRVTQLVREARARIDTIASEHGMTALPSATNFVAIDCGQDGDFARSVLSELVSRGVFVRMPFVAPQDRCIRISCGLSSSLDLFEREFGPALAAAGRS